MVKTVKTYGFYIGYDYISVVSRNIDTPLVTPLFIHPLDKTRDRNSEIVSAFNMVISGKHIRSKKSSVVMLSFEAPENILFVTDVAEEIENITEMMSWELFIRTGEPVKDYNISTFRIHENRHIVFAVKQKDIEFFTKQISRTGLQTVTIEPPIVSAVNLFESNYDVAGEAIVALVGRSKIVAAYIKNGDVIDIAQQTIPSSELISSEDVLKIRAEISAKYSINKGVAMYLTGDLLADKEYSDVLLDDIQNCYYMDPFKCININYDSNKELMDKYSFVFGVAVSLSQKMV
jgi:hypothetical protein